MEEQRKKKIRRQNIISICILVVGTILSFLIFGPKKIQNQGDQIETNSKSTAQVRTVIVGGQETKIAKLEKTVIFNSTSDASVIAEYSGRLTKVSFEVGAYVEEGQVIACFDQSRNQNSPLINLNSAQSALNIAKQNLTQTEKLVEENMELAKNARKIAELQFEQAQDVPDNSDQEDITERNLENAKDLEDLAEIQAELNLNNARLQVTQSTSSLQNAKVAYEKTIIRAPISGLVVSKEIDNDDYITAGTRVASITGAGKLQTTTSLSAAQIERIKIGDEVQINIGENWYIGEIVSFSPVANSQNERFDVFIKTEQELSGDANRNGKIFLNLYLAETKEDTFFVPLEAVNIGQQKTIVYVLADGKAVSRAVQIGEVIGTQIEITSGISSGEEIIIENSRNIQEGQKVNVQQEK